MFLSEYQCAWIVALYLLYQDRRVSIRDKFIEAFNVSNETSVTLHQNQFKRIYQQFFTHKSVKKIKTVRMI